MTGSSKNSTENYPRKCFWTQEKETQVKFNSGLGANRPSNNWAQITRMSPVQAFNDCSALEATLWFQFKSNVFSDGFRRYYEAFWEK